MAKGVLNLPDKPGCYLFKDVNGDIIYVGKAKVLKKRVKSYFQKKDHDQKTQNLVKNIESVEFIITNNEIEALLVENALIKRHKPKYNIDLRESQRYAYLLITEEEFPRLLTARDKDMKGKYFGPFVAGFDRKHMQQALIRIFKLRTCRKFPKRPCLRYHINLCDAPCIGGTSEEEYDLSISRIESFLKGNEASIVSELREEMVSYSDNMEYEKALKVREQIAALENLQQRQDVIREKRYNEDIINYIVKQDRVYLMLFNIYKGTLINKSEFSFDYMKGFLENFISQYYDCHPVPKELILPKMIDGLVKDFLAYKKKSKVVVNVPKRGEKRKLLMLVKMNIEHSVFGHEKKAEYLRGSLSLEFDPKIIECFDISHLSGTSTTGSMVQFRNGRPDKSNYRRFRIRSYLGNDDFSGISEVVSRRYRRLRDEGQGYPDLIIIDGGKGQLKAALASLKKLEISIPIISIAKHFEEIFLPGKKDPILLDEKDKGLQYIREIRDEAHRFAIKYNKLLRRKKLKT